jgi:nitrate reductase gamma subunit
VAGLIVIFVAPGLALMGWVIGLAEPDALMPLFGVAGLVGFVGIGLLTAARFLERATRQDSAENRNAFR